jgi:UDP-3-O-[3-hydroxymyristoyl] N-acetylglucosamine deacetylase
MARNRTIAREIRIAGSGVHTGKIAHLTLRPSDSGEIVFLRPDLGNSRIPVSVDRVECLNSTTLLGEKFKVRTVEHLLASLFAFGIRSLDIELDADEVPILDGSSRAFVHELEEAGRRDVGGDIPGIRIVKPLSVRENDAAILFEPPASGEGLRLSYTIAFAHPIIGNESLSLDFGRDMFIHEIAPARTFGFLKDVEMLRSQGLALGASFDNTVVLDNEKVLNGPLRFPDEFVRHKLLDLAGDLALLGRPLFGRITAHKAGHRLHLKGIQFLAHNPDYWMMQ